MNETKDLLSKTYNLSYDAEMGVVFHWSRHRGWVPLSRRTTNKGAFYVFKHEGRPTYVNEKVIIEAFTEEQCNNWKELRRLLKEGSGTENSCNLSDEEFIAAMEGIENAKEHEEDN